LQSREGAASIGLHRVGGDTMVTVQQLYHTLPAQSTPSSVFIGHPPTTAVTAYISITKNENSYAMNIGILISGAIERSGCPLKWLYIGRKRSWPDFSDSL